MIDPMSSSDIEKVSNQGYHVGWFTRDCQSQCGRRFAALADAATDYLLFSLGIGRWEPLTGTWPRATRGE